VTQACKPPSYSLQNLGHLWTGCGGYFGQAGFATPAWQSRNTDPLPLRTIFRSTQRAQMLCCKTGGNESASGCTSSCGLCSDIRGFQFVQLSDGNARGYVGQRRFALNMGNTSPQRKPVDPSVVVWVSSLYLALPIRFTGWKRWKPMPRFLMQFPKDTETKHAICPL
jgi:hypothetical protein